MAQKCSADDVEDNDDDGSIYLTQYNYNKVMWSCVELQ